MGRAQFDKRVLSLAINLAFSIQLFGNTPSVAQKLKNNQSFKEFLIIYTVISL